MIQRISKGHSKASGKKKSGFVYKPRSEKKMKERAEQQGGGFDSPFQSGLDIWRPKAGDNLIRILPPTWDDADHYGMDIWVHGFVGADKGSYLCPAKMRNKPCPICAAAKECRDANETDEAKQLEPKKQLLTWIIDRDDDNGLPQLYQMSWTMDRDIAALCYNKRTGKILSIDHPDEGYDVTIKRSGQGLKTRYFGIAIDRDPSPIADEAKTQDKIMDLIQETPLPNVLKFYSTEHLQKVVDGVSEQTDEDAGDEDEDEEQEERQSTKKSKKPSRDEDEDDEEQEDESDEDEESEDETDEDSEDESDDEGESDEDEDEDEEPHRPLKKTSRRGKSDDDEEEESEDEDEESEDEEQEDEPEDEEEESDDEEEEDERPARRNKPNKVRRKK